MFEQAHTPKRLEHHWAAWEHLDAEAQAYLQRADAFQALARQVDAEFALIDLATGQLRDPVAGAERLRGVGRQLQTWSGAIYQKLSSYLINLSDQLFSYQPVLSQALAPLLERWGTPVLHALSRLWQIEAEDRRRPRPLAEHAVRQVQWEQCCGRASIAASRPTKAVWNCFVFCITCDRFSAANAPVIAQLNWLGSRCRTTR